MDRQNGDSPARLITVLSEPPWPAEDRLTLAGDAYRHLFRARRLAAGDSVRVVDGEGAARWARITSVERRRAELALGDPAPDGEPKRRVEVIAALPRGPRASWLVEKVTEVGGAAIRWLASERAPRALGEGTIERLRRVAAAAVEQSHRSRLPEISGVHAWSEVPGLLAAVEAAYVLDPRAEPLPGPPSGASTAILVGPEGGFTGDEREALWAAGCRPVCMGGTVLRVETAALIGAAWALGGLH